MTRPVLVLRLLRIFAVALSGSGEPCELKEPKDFRFAVSLSKGVFRENERSRLKVGKAGGGMTGHRRASEPHMQPP